MIFDRSESCGVERLPPHLGPTRHDAQHSPRLQCQALPPLLLVHNYCSLSVVVIIIQIPRFVFEYTANPMHRSIHNR